MTLPFVRSKVIPDALRKIPGKTIKNCDPYSSDLEVKATEQRDAFSVSASSKIQQAENHFATHILGLDEPEAPTNSETGADGESSRNGKWQVFGEC